MGLRSIVPAGWPILCPQFWLMVSTWLDSALPLTLTTLHSDFCVVLIMSSSGFVFTMLFPTLHSSHPFHVALLLIYFTKPAFYSLLRSLFPWVSGTLNSLCMMPMCASNSSPERAQFHSVLLASSPSQINENYLNRQGNSLCVFL